jgi:hypothetical protein
VIGLIARCRVRSAIRAVIGLMALGEPGLIDLDGFRELDFLKDRSDISAVVIETSHRAPRKGARAHSGRVVAMLAWPSHSWTFHHFEAAVLGRAYL